jgi:hypothetical protein
MGESSIPHDRPCDDERLNKIPIRVESRMRGRSFGGLEFRADSQFRWRSPAHLVHAFEDEAAVVVHAVGSALEGCG